MAEVNQSELSPILRQYVSIKRDYADCILMFRIGEFYEMYFEDGIKAANLLELNMISRKYGGTEQKYCGIPAASIEQYRARLLKAGCKVAICEQIFTESGENGVVQRQVNSVTTPGTITDQELLDGDCNNYLCSISANGGKLAFAFADITTGECIAVSKNCTDYAQHILAELEKYSPAEILLCKNLFDNAELLECIKRNFPVTPEINSAYFNNIAKLSGVINEQFPGNKLDIADHTLVEAVGVLLGYIKRVNPNALKLIGSISAINESGVMQIDYSTAKNLELTRNMRFNKSEGSLLSVIDKTVTNMGARLLRKNLQQPLADAVKIRARHEAVGQLIFMHRMHSEIRELLCGVKDIERLCARVAQSKIAVRELFLLRDSIQLLPKLRELLAPANEPLLAEIRSGIDSMHDINALLQDALGEPTHNAYIKQGYNAEADDLRNAINNAAEYIEKLEQQQRTSTKIKSLKIKYNKVIGYFYELPLSVKQNTLPPTFVKKQELSNCARYICGDLKEIESHILGANERLSALEGEILETISTQVAAQTQRLMDTAQSIALLDYLCSLAVIAKENNYVKPAITGAGGISIKNGRHPVVEKLVKEYVSNDCSLGDKHSLIILTGPNMSGKSTYIRQLALIVIMAQMGGYVPAEHATISVVDKIYTRTGSADYQLGGDSTFMVEMKELCNIIGGSTKSSLILLDEIGRGTSTYDGICIAQAVTEHLAAAGIKTIFSTHFHELTVLANKIGSIRNCCIATDKSDDDISFLYKVSDGVADESYGIEIARLAGIPDKIIERAKQLHKTYK